MTKPAIPHDPDAEKAIIGDMLALPESVAELVEVIEATDFYDPRCREAFAVLVEAWREGRAVDMLALSRELEGRGVQATHEWWMDVASSGSSAYLAHAKIVVDHKARRDGIAVLTEALAAIRVGDPLEVRDRVCRDLSTMVGSMPQRPVGLSPAEEVINADIAPEPWVIPGMLRRGWRCVMVAGEGIGKSELLRQFALTTSQGLHPLGFKEMQHTVRVLLVDLENSLSGVRRSLRRMYEKIPRDEWVAGNITIWSRPGGIDLRSRVGHSELERAVIEAEPALVLIGPAYKMYRRHGDTDEDAVADVQRILDELRVRYQFAMVLEHHAPHGHQGVRDMRPVGSSWWLRWPDLGFGLVPKEPNSHRVLSLYKWRGDREENTWPIEISRGEKWGWPWQGLWPDSKWSDVMDEPEAML